MKVGRGRIEVWRRGVEAATGGAAMRGKEKLWRRWMTIRGRFMRVRAAWMMNLRILRRNRVFS